METAMGYLDQDEKAYMSSDGRGWITKITKLAKEYPDEVIITQQPEENDGCIVAYFPKKWLKITPPRKVDMTEEQREKRNERMKILREKQHQKRLSENMN